MKSRKKQMMISICLIILLFLVVIGISYATFSYIGKGSTVNQITTGTISMTYEESSNVIKITNALPTRDETGKVRLVDGEYFDFSVTTNLSGNAVINYEIAAEDFSDNTFDGSNVKFYLTKLEGSNEIPVNETLPKVYNEELEENVSTGRPSNMMSLLVGSTSTVGEETTNYRLRLYVDENYNPQGDGGGLIFKTRINVYGKVDVNEEIQVPKEQWPVMRAYSPSTAPDYHGAAYKSKVTSIVTKKDTNIPDTAIEVENGKGNYWDVSAAGDDSVIAYAEDDGSGRYKITIGGKGGITANSNSNHLFYDFTNLITINLDSFNTVKVTEMRYMFYGCKNLINLDLSGFDTSEVTNMEHMFSGCRNLQSLNISNFNTAKVLVMASMFLYCDKLTSLDVSSFDTSNVIYMQSMFQNCSSLINLNLSNFSNLKVINMQDMFSDCNSLVNLDLSNFGTSSVKSMYSMFRLCNNLSSLDLSSFDTSNVADVGYMFMQCSNLTSILVSDKWILKSTNNIDSMFQNCGTDHVTVI